MNTPDTPSHLYKLLSCLTEEEASRFPGWLKNELQGKQVSMWNWFVQIWQQKSPQEAWAHLYPATPYHPKQVNRLNNRLIKWVEEFLAIESFRKDKLDQLHHLGRVLIRRSPEEAFPPMVRKIANRLDKQPIKDRTYFRVKFELDRLDAEYLNLFPANKIRRYDPKPEQWNEHEILHVYLNQMELALRRINQPNNQQDPFISALDEFAYQQLVLFIQSHGPDKSPVAFIYQQVYGYLKNGCTLTHFEAQELVDWLKDEETEHYKLFRKDALFSLTTLIHNCINRSREKSQHQGPEWLELLFDLFSWLMEKELLFTNRVIFGNLIRIKVLLASHHQNNPAKRKKHLEDAKECLEMYKEKLPKKEREMVYNFNKGRILFAERKFKEFMELARFLRRNPPAVKDRLLELEFDLLEMKAQYEFATGDKQMEIIPFEETLHNLITRFRNADNIPLRFKERTLNQLTHFFSVDTTYSRTQAPKSTGSLS